MQFYDQWLQANHLVDPIDSGSREGCSSHGDVSGGNVTKTNDIPKAIGTNPGPTFCIVTWGDSDIGTVLKEQCRRLGIELPSYFHQWINLKSLFKQHFGWEPHGGLQKVVEKCGFSFDGRAHSGLVDSRNTAKIVKRMLEEGFRFTKATRNIHAYRPRP
jgi:inhibitor of KinA sporulation pathway (predicted exonuclease)